MKEYMVRLRDYNGNVIDGDIYIARTKKEARERYLSRVQRLGIDVCRYDYITVDIIR